MSHSNSVASFKERKNGIKNLFSGAGLQCAEAVTLGMPFEVWKTRMGCFRNETTTESLVKIYRTKGIRSFWNGTSSKLVEAATKGGVLLFSKEWILEFSKYCGLDDIKSGFISGAGAGICQTIVMSPTTFLITSCVVNSHKKTTISKEIKQAYERRGLKGFYAGSTAIALRQATNWASRQGLTELCRDFFKAQNNISKNDSIQLKKLKNHDYLSTTQEVLSGIFGGVLSTWNQPFEVARIYMQASSNQGLEKKNIISVFKNIVELNGVQGLFKGIVPRIGLSVWQTLFMVTGAKLLQKYNYL